MAIFRMRDFGKAGIMNDIPSYDLPSAAWSDGKNIRFEAGRVQKIGGWVTTAVTAMPFHNVTGEGGAVHTETKTPIACTGRPLSEGLIYGTEDAIYLAEGISHTDISNPDYKAKDGRTHYAATHLDRWEYTTLSNVVVFTNRNDDPQGLQPDTTNFVNLPGWGVPSQSDWDVTLYPPTIKPDEEIKNRVDWKTPVMRAFKNHLVCLGINEGGTEMPQRIRWSDVAYLGLLPTNWIQDWESSDAGFNDLTDSFGRIIDGRPLRDSLIIYTNRDTFAMDYVGGTLVFNFRKIFPDSGLLSKNCVAEFELGHFVISEEDIFVHDGSTRTPVASSRVKDHLLKEITSTKYDATFVNVDTHHNEIWICYVSPDAVNTSGNEWACNKAAIWNWKFDTWTYADLPNVFDITSNIPPDTDKRQWDEYHTQPDDNWNGAPHAEEHWEFLSNSFTNRRYIAASDDDCFYILDSGYYNNRVEWTPGATDVAPTFTVSQKPINCWLERTGLDFDEQENDISYNKCWRAIYPQMGGVGEVLFQVGGANDPWSAPTYDSKQFFKISEDFRVDCWSNYKYNAVKVLDTSEGDWSFTGFDIDYFREGNR